MADVKYKDVRSRIATCLLLNRLSKNYQYSQLIGVQDQSYYTEPAIRDRNTNTTLGSANKQEIKGLLQI